MLALFIIAGFVSILVHEMGHALMIRRNKLPTQVVLSNFGGYAMYPAGVLNRVQSFFVTAAGPGLQVLAAVALYFALPFLKLENFMMFYFVKTFIEISIFWAVLNCLPIVPLDGGQMLGAIMGPKRKKGLHMASILTAVIVGLFALSIGRFFGVIFMGMFAYQNYQALQQMKR